MIAVAHFSSESMSKYITTEFFKHHSRINADDDEYLDQCLDAAEDTLRQDLQVDGLTEVANSDGTLPASLRQGVLMLAGANYENRESESPVQMHADPHYWHLINRYIKYKME